ncbi:MAG: negative transcriptional regulator [Rhodospirillaceae bacterium]|nr:negative transcriptional regulator [Rhodospirillaceae bacterium]
MVFAVLEGSIAMHPHPAFRQATRDTNLRFAAQTGFGMLCVPFEGETLVSHLPFHLNPESDEFDLHLAQNNAIVSTGLVKTTATLVIQGPHGYVSPDWYQAPHQGPTWNYVAVHIKGTVVLQDRQELRRIVSELTTEFEMRVNGKSPWRSEDIKDKPMDGLMAQIVPYRFQIEAVEGTWKLDQTQPPESRLNAAAAVENSPTGLDTKALADFMRGTISEE